jgi:hypothetical protein
MPIYLSALSSPDALWVLLCCGIETDCDSRLVASSNLVVVVSLCVFSALSGLTSLNISSLSLGKCLSKCLLNPALLATW